MDIVYVSYNSEKWIEKCFDSVLCSDYDLGKVSIYVVDNGSTDNTIKKLELVKEKCSSVVRNFEIIESGKNLGFGGANNIGAKLGVDEIICFFNIDTELYSNTLSNLERDINESSEEFVLWELRQFPYEHPKIYNPLTCETSWSSGAAFAIRRDIFERMQGFDDAIFMYAEDVDLSWRIRSFGYKLKYVPKAVIKHYSYQNAGEIKPTQYVNSVINNLLLRYRFGDICTIFIGHCLFFRCLIGRKAFPGAKRLLVKGYMKHFSQIIHFMKRKYCGSKRKQVAKFVEFDYETIRNGAFYVNEFPDEKPLVSIIVRTCGRPKVLRETLISLRNQTYTNIEVVIVEDGQECAGSMIREEFSDMNIQYYATGDKVGRSRAGNKAMEMAHGQYLNFLDDDDLFYADHVEVLVRTLEKSNNKAAYAFAFETPIEVESRDPYIYTVYDYLGVYKTQFDRIELCYHNYIPIQCIMFEKTLFIDYGGLDEELDALEDWDLWVRYSLYTDFDCVSKTTSIYRVPNVAAISEKRQKELDDALRVVREKHKKYIRQLSVYDVAMMYQKHL